MARAATLTEKHCSEVIFETPTPAKWDLSSLMLSSRLNSFSGDGKGAHLNDRPRNHANFRTYVLDHDLKKGEEGG